MLKNVVYYIRDFLDRCVYFCENDKAYRKNTKNLFLFFVIFDIIFLVIFFFVNGEISIVKYFSISAIFCLFWLVIQIFYSFSTVPFDYIKPDMNNLPDKIGKYSVVVQYNPPKLLNPSEIWLIYNKKLLKTNITCLIYKWEYEWKIRVKELKDWYNTICKLKEINDVPWYEKYFWNSFFDYGYKNEITIDLDKMFFEDLNEVLLSYCKKKWWLLEECGIQWILLIFLILFEFVNPLLIIFLYISWWKVLVKSLIYSRKVIKTTDKWDELLAHIIGYKYWLEHCEEKQLKKIMKEDPSFSSKTLPYVIALRMDWRFLDKKFNK